ncbi:MAG TPA: DUF5916 domain-containing protein [Mucilaginibacter sp.]|nr:DUF5916 domain-containing protein [Mucilaginibacter sp.]
MRLFCLFIFILIIQFAYPQAPVKKLVAVRTSIAPKIDGVLDDDVWKNVPVATDFVENQPVAGRHESADNRTEIKIIYDDNAIYIGARMYEKNPADIARELTTRDSIANDDFIGLIVDTYHDGLNGSGFYVTAAGAQFDAKYSPSPDGGLEDGTWNAVWETKVKVDSLGWVAEYKIPYSALRFAKKDVQTWGLQFVRRRKAENKQLFWNEVDPKQNGLMNQEGVLDSIKKVTPPVRLAFYPYFSTYVNHYPYNTPGIKNTSTSFNGGMDVKYGINESFTLDMTLIPDFGQVQSDNQILNLTPFEVKYKENRPFFTEGTELFNKGNLFYSRRVGGQPIDYSKASQNLNPGEQVIKNPTETKLYNATKLSGRFANGLGIGVFNAVSAPSYAVIQDSAGHKRNFQTSPVTNYNIIVLDQNLKNNSDIALINTRVDRFGKDYSSDVGGVVFNLNNKRNSYNLSGYGMISSLLYTDKKTSTGFSYELNGGKTLGNFTWNVVEDLVNDKYNPNDLGILLFNNYFDHTVNLQYFDYKPGKYFTKWGLTSSFYYSRRYNPSAYQNFNQTLKGLANFKNFWGADFTLQHTGEANDFYEPRTAGRVFKVPESYMMLFKLFTNDAKRLYGGITVAHRIYVTPGRHGTDAEAYYNLRISNRLAFGQDVTYSPYMHFTGFSTADSVSKNPIFAERNVHTVQNIFTLKYTFTSDMGLTFRLRHYWSKLNNLQYFDLAQNGSLTNLTSSHFDHDNDQNYNAWNIDMVYVWQFSPGSEISIAWKNSSLSNTDKAKLGYFRNLQNTFDAPQDNNISFKILYYIDYQNLRKKKKAQ